MAWSRILTKCSVGVVPRLKWNLLELVPLRDSGDGRKGSGDDRAAQRSRRERLVRSRTTLVDGHVRAGVTNLPGLGRNRKPPVRDPRGSATILTYANDRELGEMVTRFLK